jgi:DNA-binding LacI/PurR family transcriptional regulator
VLLARDKQDTFWGPVDDFAQQAADQLNIKLSVFHTENAKRNMLQFIAKSKELDVDAVIFPNLDQIGLQLIKEAEQHKLPLLLFNSDLILLI